MGKYKFRLSDMMPNAWFYKLKDMRKIRSTKPNSRASNNSLKPSSSPSITQTTTASKNITNSLNSRNSFVYCATSAGTTADYINSRFTDPLYSSPRNYSRASDARSSVSPSRKSSHSRSRTRSRRTAIYKQKNDSFCSADQPVYYSLSSSELGSPEPDSAPNNCYRKSADFGVELVMFDELGSWSSSSLRSSCSCCCRISSSTADIIIDLNTHHNQTHQESTFSKKFQKLKEFDAASELELRPILTKLPAESDFEGMDTSELGSAIRRSVVKAPLSMGHNNKIAGGLKSPRPSLLTDSFAVVKSSVDPLRDFKDSMMEMICENNLRGFKDLENLLACYLSLNCKEYHPLIVNAFEQIWLDLFCST